MSRITVVLSGSVVAVALVVLVVAGAGLKPRPARHVLPASTITRALPADGPDVAPDVTGGYTAFDVGRDGGDDDARFDLEGDEVSPAVATYKFDAQGNIYETHAPHTEVPRLGSPRS